MVSGILYVSGVRTEHLLDGVAWIVLNMLRAVPVDISLTGITLLNNFWGSIMMLSAVWFSGEMDEARSARLTKEGIFSDLLLGTLGGEAHLTSFLVLVYFNKFGIIFVEAFSWGGPFLCYVSAGHPQQLWAGRCTQVRRQP